jgi:formate dehydrogenase subunit delta
VRQAEKLAMMANQIARNMAVRGEAEAVAATADHIRRYWDPRMRAGIAAYLAEGGRLEPIAEAAVRRLGAGAAAEPPTPAGG